MEPSFVLNLVDWNMFTEKRAEVYRTLTTAVPMGALLPTDVWETFATVLLELLILHENEQVSHNIPCHRVVGQKSLGDTHLRYNGRGSYWSGN